MQAFGRFVVRFRIPILLLVAVITGYLGYRALDLKVNSDIVTYLPPDKEAVHLFKKVGSTFGGNSMIMIALETDGETLFTKEGLGLLRSIVEACEETHGVHNTISISNILDITKNEEGIEVKKLIPGDHLPEDPAELAEIQQRALSKDMYNGKLVSANGRLATVIVRLADGVDRGVLALGIRTKVDEIMAGTQGGQAHYKAYYGGLPIWTAALSEIILHDMALLIPFVAIMLILILFVSFRSLRGVFLPLLNVGVAVIWVMGLMTVFGMQLTMISNVIPVLLMAVGSAYGIHFINAYNEDLQPGETAAERLPKVTARIGIPILMAALTTFAGFISFVTSYLSLFVEFGLLTAMGVAFAFLLALTMVPAILSFLPAKKQVVKEGPDLPIAKRLLTGLGRTAATHRLAWGIGFLVVTGLMAFGATRISRSVNLSAYFPEDHYIQKSDKVLDAHFGGTAPIQILVRGDIKDPFVLKQMFEIEKFLDSLPRVTGSNSIASLVAELNEQMNGRYAIPDSAEGVGNLFTFIEGDDILERMVYPTGSYRPSMALIQAFMSTGDSALLVSTSKVVRAYLTDKALTGWEVLPVTGTEKFGAGMSELQKQRIARAARLILFDVEKRLPETSQTKPDLAVEQLLLDVMGGSPASDPAAAEALAKAMLDYAVGDEAEFSPGDEETKALTAQFVEVVKGKVDLAGLEGALRKGLKAETIEEDPEGVPAMAKSLLRRYEEKVQAILVQRAQEKILALLPADLAANPWLVRDVRGDLWELMDSYVAVAGKQSEPAASPIQRIVEVSKDLNPAGEGGFGYTSPYTADPEAILLEAMLTPIPFKELGDAAAVSKALVEGSPGKVSDLSEEQRTAFAEGLAELLQGDEMTQSRVARLVLRVAPAKAEALAFSEAGAVLAVYDEVVRPARDAWAIRLVEERLTAKLHAEKLEGRVLQTLFSAELESKSLEEAMSAAPELWEKRKAQAAAVIAQMDPAKAVEQFKASLSGLADQSKLRAQAAYAATGMPRIYEEMDDNLISSQLQSLLLALFLTFLLLSIQFKSVIAGGVALVPIIFTVMAEFGLMAFAGVALDTATVLIASLAVGIGIDYTIHYMARVRLEASRRDSVFESILETSKTTGVAIVINAVSVAAGFVVLVAANLVPLQNFGWMTATTMIIAAIAALTLVPLMLSSSRISRFLKPKG